MNMRERALRRERRREALRRRRIFWSAAALLLAGTLLGGASLLARGTPSGSGSTGGNVAASPSREAALQTAIEKGGTPVSATPREQAATTVAGHRQRLEADPDSPEAAALLNAMGNLYRQKMGDYEHAAQCYEDLLHQYPDWEGNRNVYLNLVVTYRALEKEDYINWTYRRMMERYPEDSQEYLYAKSELGL